ncbi:hypothetical protein D3C85_638640 [compost metagenome]
MLDEGAGRGIGQVLDGFAAQDRQFASARIAGTELAVGLRQVIAHQSQQQGLDFGVFQQLHFQAVFQVDQRIADVVGGLHQVHQRMPRPALVLQLWQAEFMGDLFQQRQLALITPELVFLVSQRVGVPGRPWILQVRAQRCIRQSGAAVELVILQLSEYPKALGIAFEIQEVIALGFTHCIQPATAGGLLEPMADRVFTGMAERRVADVVCQAGRLHHHPQVAGFAPFGQGPADGFADAHAQ